MNLDSPNSLDQTQSLITRFTAKFNISVARNALGLLALACVFNFLAISEASAQLFQRDNDQQTEQTEDLSTQEQAAAKNIFGLGEDGKVEAQPEREPEVDPDGWQVLQPTGANLAFRMPIKPRYVERSFTPILGLDPIVVRMHIATESKERSSILSYHDLHDEPLTAKEVKEILDGAVKGNVARVLGRLDEVKEIKVDGYPAREFSFSYTQDELVHKAAARVVLAGKRQCQITVLNLSGSEDPAFTEKLLNSLVVYDQEQATEDETADTANHADAGNELNRK